MFNTTRFSSILRRNFVLHCSKRALLRRSFRSSTLSRSQSDVDDDRPVNHQPPYNILFFGSDNIALTTLQKIVQNRDGLDKQRQKVVGNLEIVCPKLSIKGSPLPVAKFAHDNKIKLYEKPKKVSLSSWKGPNYNDFDIGVVVSFGYFIPASIIEQFRVTSLNLHPSLLPKYRGAAPIYHAMLDGCSETGVSVITLDKQKFDVGLLVEQQREAIERDERYEQLSARLAERGAEALLDVLADLEPRLARAVPQQGRASAAPRVSAKSGAVVWQAGVERLWRQWRALAGSFGVHAMWRSQRITLLQLMSPQRSRELSAPLVASRFTSAEPGQFFFARRANALFVYVGDAWLGIERLVVAGRRPLTARQFAVGYQMGRAELHQFEEIKFE